MSKHGPPAETKPPPTTTAYAVERSGDNIFRAVTITIRGQSVVSRVESEADSLAATLGRLFTSIARAHTT